MLKRISIGNFKSISGVHPLELKPITVLAGLNSSGKSTVLQSILLLSQTLTNPNPEKVLILNGNIIQLGTFDAVHNERDESSDIELGFTLTLAKNQNPSVQERSSRQYRRYSGLEDSVREVGVDTTFRSASSRPGDQSAIEAVKVALQRCKLTVSFESSGDEEPQWMDFGDVYAERERKFTAIAEISPLSPSDQAAFLKGVKDEFLSLVPYPEGQNFLLRLTAEEGTSSNRQLLTRLSHFLPDKLVGKYSLQERQERELSLAITILSERKEMLRYLPRSRQSIAERVSTHPITDRLREKFQTLSQPKNAVPFNGSTVGELFDWARKTPLKARAKNNFIQNIRELVLPEVIASLYRSVNTQECGLESIMDDLQTTAIDLASRRVVSFFSTMIRYLGPLRADPQAAQGFAPSNEPDDVGFKGEYAAAVYDANKRQVVRWWHPVLAAIQEGPLEDALNEWAKHVGVAQKVATKEAGTAGVAWAVQPLPNSPERPLQAVGIGVSQVLPILVSGLLAPTGAVILIEQPELHLHARAQSRLGEFFIGLARTGKQCVVETHSDCLVNQLRLAMVKGGSSTRDLVGIYFVEQDELGRSRFSPIEISPSGNIVNWPDGFFDENIQLEERIANEAVMARQRNQTSESR